VRGARGSRTARATSSVSASLCADVSYRMSSTLGRITRLADVCWATRQDSPLTAKWRVGTSGESGGAGVRELARPLPTTPDVCAMSRGAKDDTLLPTRIEVRQQGSQPTPGGRE
jgi:hypothetical protein